MFFCVFPSMNTADCAGWGRNATWGRVGRVRIGETGNNMGGVAGNSVNTPCPTILPLRISKELSCRQQQLHWRVKYFRLATLWTSLKGSAFATPPSQTFFQPQISLPSTRF